MIALLTAVVLLLAGPVPATEAPLTNLAHLDFLTAAVTPPAQTGHTTYRLAQQPSIGVLWVYGSADRSPWQRDRRSPEATTSADG
jgi:hypothetical protein